MKAPLLVKPPEDIGVVVQKSLQQFRGREVGLKEVLGYALRLLSDYKKFDSVASKDVQREWMRVSSTAVKTELVRLGCRLDVVKQTVVFIS